MNDAQNRNCSISLYSAFPAVTGTLYGIALTLYCLCFQSVHLALSNPDKRRRAIFSLTYLSFLMVLITSVVVLSIGVIHMAYINHVGFAQELSDHECQPRTIPPIIIALGTTWTLIQLLTLGIQVRRIWIIWSATPYAVVVSALPMVLVLAYLVLFVVIIALTSHHRTIPQEIAKAVFMTIYVLGPALTTFVTLLIAIRLLLVRRQLMRIIGTSDSIYLSIVTVLVESYALETVWSLVAVVLVAVGSPSCVFLIQTDPIVKGIVYFLIVYRVQNGRGWTKQTEERLTSLQFNHSAETKSTSIPSQSV